MRNRTATALLAFCLVLAPFGSLAGAQDFEDLVEDALERNSPDGAPPAESAVPPRLRPAAPGTEAPVTIAPAPAAPPPAAVPGAPAVVPAAPLPGTAEQAPRPYTPPAPVNPPAAAETPAATETPAAPESSAGTTAPGAPAPTGGEAAPSAAQRSMAALSVEAVNAATFDPGALAVRGANALVLKAQILLDRAGASPGVIDGIYGGNVAKAIAAVETVLNLPIDGRLDPQVWAALGGDRAPAVLVDYTVTPEDAAGPFIPDIPADYAEQAELPSLAFRNALEMFGERFHMDTDLLEALNPGADFGRAGTTIVVAAIEGQPITGKIARIEADKRSRQLRAFDSQNRLVAAYPATIGSSDNPSPSGVHKVNTIAPNPVYYYNPSNFVQGNNTEKLELPPGPNNPVGTMWIDLSEPSYGIHGTPEPSRIDKTGSHGCVRLTNWDAEELAGLVEAGVTVEFIE